MDVKSTTHTLRYVSRFDVTVPIFAEKMFDVLKKLITSTTLFHQLIISKMEKKTKTVYLLEIGYLSWHNTSFPLWMFLTTEAASHSLYKRNKNHAIEKKSFKHFVEKKNLQCIKLNSISHFKERTDQYLIWKYFSKLSFNS